MRHGGLGVGSGSFFVGFRGRVRVGDSIRGSIYKRDKDLFTFFVYLPSGHPVHPLGDIYNRNAPKEKVSDRTEDMKEAQKHHPRKTIGGERGQDSRGWILRSSWEKKNLVCHHSFNMK